MTCTAARNCSSCATNSTATPNRVATRHSAECTGLDSTTTPTAPERMMIAATTKTNRSMSVLRDLGVGRKGVAVGIDVDVGLGLDPVVHLLFRVVGLLVDGLGHDVVRV